MNQEEQNNAQTAIELDLSQQQNASEHATIATATPQNNAKKWLVFALPVVAVILIFAVLLLTVAGGSPLKKAENAIAKTASAFGKVEPARVMDQVLSHGSVEFTMYLNELTQSLLGVGVDGTYSLKTYMDAKNHQAASLIDFTLGNAQLDATFYGNNDTFVLDSTTLLDGALGIEKKNALERLDASIFNPDRGTRYAMDRELYDTLRQSLETTEAVATFYQDTGKLLLEAYGTLRKSVENNANITEMAGAVACFEEDVNVNTIAIELDNHATAAVAREMLTWAQESEHLRAWLNQLIALYGAQIENAGAGYLGYGFTVDENTVDAFYQALENAQNGIDAWETALGDDFMLGLRFHIRKSDGTLAQFEYRIDQTGEIDDVNLTVSFAANPTEGIMVAYVDVWTDATHTYTVDCDTDTAYHAEFVALDEGDPLYTIDFTWDKAVGDFCVSFVDEWMDENVSLYGAMMCTDRDVTIQLDRVEAAGTTVKLGTTLVLKESDTMPTMPDYTDILAYTDEAAFDDVVSGVLAGFNQFVSDSGLY